MSQRSMEMKVGALMVTSLVLLVGFIVLMGGLSLQPTFRVFVDFDDPGGLQSGAPVRISGVRVGRITAIEFRGGDKDERGKPVKPIRVIASIESQHKKALHDDAIFFVTSQGLLGEMHLAVDPGSHKRPLLEDGAVVDGVSPPRLDQLLSESYELLHRSYLGLVRNEEKIAETFDGLHKTLRATGNLLEKHEQDISSIVTRLDRIAGEAEETLVAARERVDTDRDVAGGDVVIGVAKAGGHQLDLDLARTWVVDLEVHFIRLGLLVEASRKLVVEVSISLLVVDGRRLGGLRFVRVVLPRGVRIEIRQPLLQFLLAGVGDLGIAFYAGVTNGPLQGQLSIPGQVVLAKLGIEAIPIFNVENGCASGSSAFHLAVQSLRMGETGASEWNAKS